PSVLAHVLALDIEVGLYLWEHIFNADLEERLGGVWSYATKRIGSITFRWVSSGSYSIDGYCEDRRGVGCSWTQAVSPCGIRPTL
ncbi:hypothetical protein BaRGS_00012076, partial [Batillaria attramentaria]